MLEIIINKSVEIVLALLLKKVWGWVLSDRNFKSLHQSLKKQILLLYLHWVLLKAKVKVVSDELQHDAYTEG
ncbi:hypothetical protein NUACC21_26230 [Scytonema sp. NUACC21]